MSVNPNPQTLPFSIENAFTDRIEGGNPAVVVRVPSLTALPDTTLQTIATNFNQPITVFITPRETNASDPSGTATFGIVVRPAARGPALRARHARGRGRGVPKREGYAGPDRDTI
jgi:hypothetical protein